VTLEEVTLIMGGRVLEKFQEVNVTRAMTNAAITFGLKATNPAWHPDAFALRLGVEVELLASGDRLVKGFVDAYEADHGERDSHEVRVSGRSKAADCIDCQPAKHKTGRVEKKTLLDAAREFDEFGTRWSTDQKLKPLDKIQRNPTETVFETIERYARKQGLMLVGEPDGGIKITRAGEQRHAASLVEGSSPIKRYSVKFSSSGKFSPVVVRGQRAVGSDAKALRQEVQEFDPSVGRYRPLIVFVEGDSTERALKNRAQWERLRRAGGAISATVILASWRDDDGKLWEPGRLVAVDFPSERLEQDLSISSVTFRQDHNGTIAELTLVDPRTQGGKKPKGKSDKAYDVVQGNLDE
jgi:prophage tail gpP-like protein